MSSQEEPVPIEQDSLDEQEQAEFQPGENEANQEAVDAQDEKPVAQSDQLDQEADQLDKSNIIDDDSGPGGRSLRSNRGDPTESVSCSR
jgi:hypothetical protein